MTTIMPCSKHMVARNTLSIVSLLLLVFAPFQALRLPVASPLGGQSLPARPMEYVAAPVACGGQASDEPRTSKVQPQVSRAGRLARARVPVRLPMPCPARRCRISAAAYAVPVSSVWTPNCLHTLLSKTGFPCLFQQS